MGHQGHAEHVVGELTHLLDRFRELDAAAFAAATGVDLRLHHPKRATKLPGCGLCFLRRVSDLTAQHVDAIFLEQTFGLVLMNVHR